MGGLAGWIDFEGDLRLEREVLDRMTAKLPNPAAVTPDCWLGLHAALAQCATHGEGGAGMCHPAAGLVLAFSGQPDNLDELAARLALPDTLDPQVPASVILGAYVRWGPAFVGKLSGSFAFAIWDEREQTLTLGRDRFGIQPLYYTLTRGGIVFGSLPDVLFANARVTPRLACASIGIALQPRLALPGETPLRDVHEVPPAHVLTLRKGAVSKSRYWRLESLPHTQSFDETAHQVRRLLADAVAKQIRTASPGNIGGLLSGGLDSTSVAALAMQSLRALGSTEGLHTYCIDFRTDSPSFEPTAIRPEIDAPYAARAAAYIGSQHRTLPIDLAALDDAVPATQQARGLPGWGQMDASMLLLFREMSKTCRVAVTGEIADELFGGYPQFFDPVLIQRQQFPWLDDGARLGSFLSPTLFPGYDPAEDERIRYASILADVPSLPGEDPANARMREVLYVSMAGRMAVLLDRMQRMSAFSGADIRLPFCDHRLAEYVWNVPWTMKSHGGMKGLLKAAMADLLPASTLERKKSAYPHVQDAAYDRRLADEALAIIDRSDAAVAPLFDLPRLRAFIAGMKEQGRCKRESHLLVQLIEFERWLCAQEVSIG